MIPGVFAAQAVSQGHRLWTPADLSDPPKVWLDWNSPVDDPGGHLAAWDNLGEIGGSAIQPGSGSRPVAIVGPGGVRAWKFDGSNDYLYMQGPGPSGLFRAVGHGWQFHVARSNMTAGSPRIFVDSRFPSSRGVRFYTSFAFPDGLRSGTRFVDRGAASNSPYVAPVDDWHIAYLHANWVGGESSINLNGGALASAPMDTSGLTEDVGSYNDYLGIGNRAGALVSGEYLHADVAAIVVGSGSLPSPEERQRLEGWAAHACGLQANLPLDHPYRYSPPYV